jgi:N-acetylglucosamine-6-phosphate deacetylase
MAHTARHMFINGVASTGAEDSDFDFIVPGFIDIHCHGGGGKYFSESAEVAAQVHRLNGTVVQLASLVSESIPTLVSQIKTLKNSDQVFGIHLEGPYLSQRFCGAHDPSLLKAPVLSEVKELVSIGEGKIKMVTIAPELDGAIEAIEYLVSQKVVVSIGHSNANAQQTRDAISAGATAVTHINNGMSKLGTLDSLSEVALESELFLELIQDGHHVSRQDSLLIINKAPHRIIAVTDAMSAAGCHDGGYLIGSLPVEVNAGVARLKGSQTLAGSTLTMVESFNNYFNLVGFESAVEFTSLNPAKLLGIDIPNSYIGIKDGLVTHLVNL